MIEELILQIKSALVEGDKKKANALTGLLAHKLQFDIEFPDYETEKETTK